MDKRARIAVKAVAIAIVLLIVYIFLPVITEFVEHPPGAAYILLPKKVEFDLERVVDISARTFTVNFTIPINTTYQNVVVEDLTTYPKTVHHEYNRTWWSYSLSGSAQIRIRIRGESISKVWRIYKSKGINDIPSNLKSQYNHREYMKSSSGSIRWVIDPDAFRDITINITQDKKDVVGELRAIYDVIVQNFQYVAERTGDPKTAVETWNSRRGDCDELSFVFVSMARSIGIPAWVEYGMLYNGNTWGQHAWVGTVIPTSSGSQYVNIDVTAEVGREDLGRGFLIRDPYRITLWVEDGNSEHLSSFYSFLRYTAPPNLSYQENVVIHKISAEGEERVYVGDTIPSWLMLLIFLVIIIAAIAIIVKF